jgi:hypothetical protein
LKKHCGVVLLSASIVAACGPARFPGQARDCGLEIAGLGVSAAQCFEAPTARVTAVRIAAAGNVIVAGTFADRLAFGGATPMRAVAGQGQAFVAGFTPDLTTQFARAVDAPGVLRGVVAAPRGVGLITGSGDVPEGPFLTMLDPAGNVVSRRDLGFGGLVTGVATDARGVLMLRTQQDGVRLVVVSSDDGRVLGTQRVSPPWIHQFPASITADALVSDVALFSDGAYTLHARAPSDDGDQAMSKMQLGSGAVAWTRPVHVGTNAQLVAMAGGTAALTPDAIALCPGRGFAIAAFDGEAALRWQRCFAAHATELRLMTDPAGRLVVTGQMDGSADLGGGMFSVPADKLASFVLLLDERGETRRAALLSGPAIAAVQAVAVAPDGAVVVAGAVARSAAGEGRGALQTHLFVASLRD